MSTLLFAHLSAGLIAFILGAFTHLLHVNMKRSEALEQEILEQAGPVQEARNREKGS